MSIIFLLTGNAREFPFNIQYHMRNTEILDSYNKYIFTDKFKSLYKYKIYISTDDIHLADTVNYFSEDNIGNIHLLNTDYYRKHVNNKTENVNKYFDIYNNKDWSNHWKYDNSIHQHYKILDCYNLFKNDNLENCDYIVRLRMDVAITMDILDVISSFTQNPELGIFLHWDWFALGKPEIMKWYCTGLENNYGNYKYDVVVPDILPVMGDYKELNRYKWTYSPERQLFEMLFDYCNCNNLDINKTIVDTNKFCKLVRTYNI